MDSSATSTGSKRRRHQQQPGRIPWRTALNLAAHLAAGTVVNVHVQVEALSITTFNVLAAVHRSVPFDNRRESERRDLWQPRAEGLARFVADELVS